MQLCAHLASWEQLCTPSQEHLPPRFPPCMLSQFCPSLADMLPTGLLLSPARSQCVPLPHDGKPRLCNSTSSKAGAAGLGGKGGAGHRRSWGMSGWGAAVQEGPGGAGDRSSEQRALVNTKVNCILGCIKHSPHAQPDGQRWSKEGILPLCLASVRSQFDHYAQFWAKQHKKDVKLLNGVGALVRRTLRILNY